MVMMASTHATILGIPYHNSFQPSNHRTSPHFHLQTPILNPNPNSQFPPPPPLSLSVSFASTLRANSAAFGTSSTLSSSGRVPQQWSQMGLRSKWKRLSLVKSSAGSQPDAEKESSINIQLPRRSLLVQFTCDACGERTKRLINRLAYERGTVFVQCAGCLQHHKLVDNLGLVVEYDFRKEAEED